MNYMNTVVRIEDLYVNFHMRAGVVKALDGVSFSIIKGETFGLVGESGCGKSVTANCILRLIAEPPGKVEKGAVIFAPYEYLEHKRKEIEDKEKALTSHDPNFQLKPEQIKKQQEEIVNLKREYEKESQVFAKLDELREKEKTLEPKSQELEGARKEYKEAAKNLDIMLWDKKRLQSFRGRSVSMIFQEPMSALNPVFTAGEQIAEVFLIHKRQEMAQSILRQMDKRFKKKMDPSAGIGTSDGKGSYVCASCGNISDKQQDVCPNCGATVKTDSLHGISDFKLKYYRVFYKQMAVNPNTRFLRWTKKIPFIRGYDRLAKREALKRSGMMLRLVRIPDPEYVVGSYPHELSGGMQQRVMIAMALACKPQLLIADEPTTALDVTIQAQILKLMKDLQKETGTTILMITHNLGVIAEICDRVGVMYAGTIVEIGTTVDIFKEPLHPYTQGLMSSIPRINHRTARLETIEGSVPNLVKPPSGCRFHPRCPYAMEICSKRNPMTEVRPGHFVACHLYSAGWNDGGRDHLSRSRPEEALPHPGGLLSRSSSRSRRWTTSPSTSGRGRPSAWWASPVAGRPPPADACSSHQTDGWGYLLEDAGRRPEGGQADEQEVCGTRRIDLEVEMETETGA